MKKVLFIGLVISTLLFAGSISAEGASVKFLRLDKAYQDIGGAKSVAVLDFQGDGGRTAAEMLVSELLKPGFYEVVERQRIKEVIAEQKLSLSGIVSDSAIREIGKILGVDAIITGAVSGYRVETNRGSLLLTPETYDTENRIRTYAAYRYFTSKTAKVAVNYRMIDAETGRVLAAKSIAKSYNSGKQYDDDPAYFQIASDEAILNDLLAAITSRAVNEFTPHYARVKRKIERGERKSSYMKRGKKLAKAGRWDDAMIVWQKALEKDPQSAATHINLGIASERKGEIEKAKREYQRAVVLEPEEKRYQKYLRSLERAYVAR